MRNLYIVVSRMKNNDVAIRKTDDFYTAMAMQRSMLLGGEDKSIDELVPVIKSNLSDVAACVNSILSFGHDRLANDVGECYILVVRGCKSLYEGVALK